jgi:drug/metabolite transporter (DMT)-like permease
MRSASALVALHVAVALFGFAALFGAWIPWSPMAIVLGRTTVAALVLAAMPASRGRPSAGLVPATVLNGALLAVHWVAFFAAVQVADVATALLGFASFPAHVLLLERLRHGRAPTAAEAATVAVVALGLALLVPVYAWNDRTTQGLVWGVGSGFTFAILALRNRKLVIVHGATSLALWQNAFAALLLLPVVLATGAMPAPGWREIVLVVLLGVLCTALAHTLFIASLRRVSAHAASVVSLLEPVYGIALAALFLGQWPDLRTLAGGLLIVGAAVAATRRAAGT